MQKKCQKNDFRFGKCKKNAKNMTPSLGNMTVLVKLRFWTFQVGPASRAPPGHFTPGPAPHPVFHPALHPSRETTPRPGRPKNEFFRGSSPALSFFTGWLSKSFCTCSLYLVLPRDNKRSVMVVMF